MAVAQGWSMEAKSGAGLAQGASHRRVLQGANLKMDPRDISDDIAFADHKIAFLVKYCKDKDVLDIGCVQHDPQAYRGRFWVHKAVATVAKSILGMDLHEEGVSVLRAQG